MYSITSNVELKSSWYLELDMAQKRFHTEVYIDKVWEINVLWRM